MTPVDRNRKIIEAIEARTKRALASKETARKMLVDEGIYHEDGTLRPEFGGDPVKKGHKAA